MRINNKCKDPSPALPSSREGSFLSLEKGKLKVALDSVMSRTCFGTDRVENPKHP